MRRADGRKNYSLVVWPRAIPPRERRRIMENRYISCREIIPEGRQMCERCMRGSVNTVSTRDKYMKDYGISHEDGKKIVEYCRTATGYEQHLILQAAQEVYPEIAPYLFFSLTTGIGYDRMGNIPMQRKDFQGYRRKTIETYNRYMMLNGKQIV